MVLKICFYYVLLTQLVEIEFSLEESLQKLLKSKIGQYLQLPKFLNWNLTAGFQFKSF